MLNKIKSLFEKRASFTDEVINNALSIATSTSVQNASKTAALEIACGLWGRAFSGAVINPDTIATRLLTPMVLCNIGRQLIRRGECLFLIRASANGLQLLPVGSWVVEGDYDPASWMYRLDLYGPTRMGTVKVSADSVLHFRYAWDPASPYIGQSPIAFAQTTGALLGNAEQNLADESLTPGGTLIAVPSTTDSSSELAGLATDLQTNKGKILLVETMATGWGEGRMGAPMGDWTPKRYGATPPSSFVDLRDRATNNILSACGVSPAMVGERADGTARREAYRQLVHTSIVPVAKLVAGEIASKLEVDVQFNFDTLFAADISARARSVGQLRSAGMALDKALETVGLN